MNSRINTLLISLKTGRYILNRINLPDTIEERFSHALHFTRHALDDKEKYIFIDKSGFNLHLRITQARSRTGTRAIVPIPAGIAEISRLF